MNTSEVLAKHAAVTNPLDTQADIAGDIPPWLEAAYQKILKKHKWTAEGP